MSKRGTEFIEKWVKENFHGREPLGRDRRPHDWAQQCVSEAIEAGIPKDEIEEDFGNLEEFMARAIAETADKKDFELEEAADPSKEG